MDSNSHRSRWCVSKPFLVVVDRHLKWIDVEIISVTSSHATVLK